MPQPQMPQGVEHLILKMVFQVCARMPQPQMPQGVEHLIPS